MEPSATPPPPADPTSFAPRRRFDTIRAGFLCAVILHAVLQGALHLLFLHGRRAAPPNSGPHIPPFVFSDISQFFYLAPLAIVFEVLFRRRAVKGVALAFVVLLLVNGALCAAIL